MHQNITTYAKKDLLRYLHHILNGVSAARSSSAEDEFFNTAKQD